MMMTNNPPRLHHASQDQNKDFFAGNPFQLQNRFQKLHAGSTYGYENGFQTQNNANSHNGIHSFQVNDDIDPYSTGNLNIYSGVIDSQTTTISMSYKAMITLFMPIM